MKVQIRLVIAVLAVAVCLGTVGAAQQSQQPAQQTWTGKLSDAMCGMDHKDNGGTMAKDHDCALGCVKGGSTHVFVVGKTIYKIDNQTFAGLQTHAGHPVTITGTLKEKTKDTIVVTKIDMGK